MKDNWELIIFAILITLLTVMCLYQQSNINDLTDQLESVNEQICYIEGVIG